MIIIHHFGIDLEEYKARGKLNEFPIKMKCLECKARGLLHRHGFYWRYGITEDHSSLIPICRLKCTSCKKTYSILPDFLIPYFQHTLQTIIQWIDQTLQREKSKGNRQLRGFYVKRYCRKLNWIHSFFIEVGEMSGVSNVKKQRAIKYLKRIQDFGESTFLRRSMGHLSSYFMAN